MKVFLTDNYSPQMNLAIESWLYNRKDLYNQNILFLYRNCPSVIIGRFQNPWLECDLQKMSDSSISFARRLSGGGAVYHDLGNTNFTFICRPEGFNKDDCTSIIIKALKPFHIDAEQGERNDIYVNKRKISGSASKYSSKRVLHHGTLLINADLEALDTFLIAKEYKKGSIHSKGIASIPSKVANLKEFNKSITHEKVSQSIIEVTSETWGEPVEMIHLSVSCLKDIREIQVNNSKMSRWDWLFGNTPSFTLTTPITVGETTITCHFSIVKGIIEEISHQQKEQDSHIITYINKYFTDKRCDELMNINIKGNSI